MTAQTVKRLASKLLGAGQNRIRIKKEELGRAMEALTREDVRALVADGAVYAIPAVGPRKKERKGRKSRGSRKGKKFSRKPAKDAWMETVRSQRKYLNELVASGELPAEHRRYVYGKIKGRAFRGKKAMRTYLEENGMIEEKKKEKKE